MLLHNPNNLYIRPVCLSIVMAFELVKEHLYKEEVRSTN